MCLVVGRTWLSHPMVYRTRGHFSKNGSFTIKTILLEVSCCIVTNACVERMILLKESCVVGQQNQWREYLLMKCYEIAKNEACIISTFWQDADWSSANSLMLYHPNGKVYKCGRHVGRAFTNNWKSAAKKEFSDEEKKRYMKKFPLSVSAKWKFKRHISGCGCLSDGSLRVRLNHFWLIQNGKDAAEYAKRYTWCSPIPLQKYL